jgi:hypothetical protein
MTIGDGICIILVTSSNVGCSRENAVEELVYNKNSKLRCGVIEKELAIPVQKVEFLKIRSKQGIIPR